MADQKLGSTFPTTTDPTLLYETPDNLKDPKITTIFVAKTIQGTARYSIYFNPAGTFDETTSLFFDVLLESGNMTEMIEIVKGLGMENQGDQIWVKSDKASSVNFTAFGQLRDK